MVYELSFVADRLVLHNVTKQDHVVVQCNASNVHGYALSTAVLSVFCTYVVMIGTVRPGLRHILDQLQLCTLNFTNEIDLSILQNFSRSIITM